MVWLSTMGLLGARLLCPQATPILLWSCQPYQELTSPAFPDFEQEGQSQVPSTNSTRASCQHRRPQQKPCLALKKPPPPPSSAQRKSPQAWKGLSSQDVPRTQLFPWADRGFTASQPPTLWAEQPCWREMLLPHTGTGKQSSCREVRLLCLKARASHAAPRRKWGQERGARGPRRTLVLALATKMGKDRTGPACPEPPLMTHVGTVVSGREVDLGVQAPGFSFLCCVCLSFSPLGTPFGV